jgi:DNA-directed RNA polymerase specialized sigma24 family protein
MRDTELLTNIKDLIKKNQYYYQIKNENDRLTVVHDTFIFIWTKLNNGELSKQWEDIMGYTFIACRNNCLSYLRKKQRQPKILSLDSEEFTVQLEQDDSEAEYQQILDKKIETIKGFLDIDLDKRILNLRLKGHRLEEIADILNMDYDKVSYINRSIVRYLNKKMNNVEYKPKSEVVLRNKEYQIINTETGEVVFKSRNKRIIADKYHLPRLRINEWVDTGRLFGGNLTIKSIHCSKSGK